MITLIKAFMAALVTMLVLDAVWLKVMANRFYRPRIGHLMAESPNLVPAGFFYVIYILGLVVLVVSPAIKRGAGWHEAFLLGALYGLVAYATYDLTNQATLKNWPISVTIVDLAWGAALTGVLGVVATFAGRYPA